MRMNKTTRGFAAYSLDLLRYHKFITLVNVLCNAVIFSHQAAVTYCVREVLNGLEHVSSGQTLQRLWPYLAAIMVVALVRVAAIMGCSSLDALRAYYYKARTRMNFLKHLLEKRDVTQVSGNANPLFGILDRDISICTFPAELLTEVTGHGVYTLIALGMLFSIHGGLTLFIFMPLSMAIYGIQRLSERMKERRKVNRAAHDEVNIFLGDVTDAAVSIKASGAVGAVLCRLDEVNAKRRGAVVRDVIYNERIAVLLEGSVCIGSAIMMFIAARLMAGNSFGIGDFSLFIAHLGTLADFISRVVELIYEARKAEVSYERVMASMEGECGPLLSQEAGISLREGEEALEPRPPQETLTAFEVKNLSFTYAEADGFRDVSFSIQPGELVALAGGVASGKSTLLNVLMGLMPAQSGTVLCNGRPCREDLGTQASWSTAGAPEHGGFFAADIKENLLLGQALGEEAVQQALRLAVLDETIAQMPDRLMTAIGGRGDQLSGGQRQRLALARVFSRTPSLSILDDCVSALDEETRTEVLRRMRKLLRETGCAVLIATNAKPFLLSADRIVYLEKGRVAGIGDYHELVEVNVGFADLVLG